MRKVSFHQGQHRGSVNEAPLIDLLHRDLGGAARQATALRQEGVTVDTGHLGELTVDFGRFGWFPGTLSSEATGASSESEGVDRG